MLIGQLSTGVVTNTRPPPAAAARSATRNAPCRTGFVSRSGRRKSGSSPGSSADQTWPSTKPTRAPHTASMKWVPKGSTSK